MRTLSTKSNDVVRRIEKLALQVYGKDTHYTLTWSFGDHLTGSGRITNAEKEWWLMASTGHSTGYQRGKTLEDVEAALQRCLEERNKQ